MKKIISSILVLTMSLCTFGATTCFADGSETTAQEVKIEQIAEQQVKSKVLSPDDLKDIAAIVEAQIKKSNKSNKNTDSAVSKEVSKLSNCDELLSLAISICSFTSLNYILWKCNMLDFSSWMICVPILFFDLFKHL